MDWLILILGVPAILIPLVLLFGFAGCVQAPVSRHPRRAPAARPRAVSGNGLVAPWRHRFIWLWPKSFPPGNYALGVLAWYGLGRFFLEPLREAPDLIAGRVRINQCVAAALVLGAGGALLARAFAW